jgi:predicted Rossmann-fold nucleotide-binding protein
MNIEGPSEHSWLSRVRDAVSDRPYATIFGSSVRGAGDPEIDRWTIIATLMAESGWGLLSGGYGGTMSYLSRAHISAGGTAVGVVCAAVPDRTPVDCYSRVISVDTPFQRLEALLRFGRVHVVLSGGIGTLVELACAIWLQDRALIEETPVILVGGQWAEWVKWFETIPAGLKGSRPIRNMVIHAATIAQFRIAWGEVRENA